MTPGPGIEPGTHWWEASALANASAPFKGEQGWHILKKTVFLSSFLVHNPSSSSLVGAVRTYSRLYFILFFICSRDSYNLKLILFWKIIYFMSTVFFNWEREVCLTKQMKDIYSPQPRPFKVILQYYLNQKCHLQAFFYNLFNNLYAVYYL